jgi:hypothetical protein
MSQRRLTYVSRVAPGVAETDIRLILGAAEVINRRLDLSGVLGYTGAHFVQVIEGPEGNVESLMSLIEADPRHGGIHVLCDEAIARRDFDHWFSAEITSLDVIDQVELLLRTAGGTCRDAAVLRHHLRDQVFPDTRI